MLNIPKPKNPKMSIIFESIIAYLIMRLSYIIVDYWNLRHHLEQMQFGGFSRLDAADDAVRRLQKETMDSGKR